MMTKQMPITQKQVENLVTSVIEGYNSLIELSNESYKKNSSSDYFNGTLEFNAVFKGDLSNNILNNMINFRLVGNILPEYIAFVSDVRLKPSDTNKLHKNLLNYIGLSNKIQQEMVDQFSAGKKSAREKTAKMRFAMNELNENIKSKNLTEIAYAIENIQQIGNWENEIKTMPLVMAGVNITELAQYARSFGFVKGEEIAINTYKGVEQSKVYKIMGFNPFTGKPFANPFKKVLPDQTYIGKLDPEIIAKELIRKNN